MYNPELLAAEIEHRSSRIKEGLGASRRRQRTRNPLVRWLADTVTSSRRELPPSAVAGDLQRAGSPTVRPGTGSGNGVTQRLIDDLAEGVVTAGLASHDAEIAAVADQAIVMGVSMTLVGVLLDQAAPEVVRLRAFGAVTRQLATLLGSADVSTQISTRESSRTAPVAVPA